MIFLVNGNDIYSYLKYESGVNRVQRIPETESNGRQNTRILEDLFEAFIVNDDGDIS